MREENTYLPAEITLPKVDFDSKLTNLIIDLEKLRHRKLAGTTPESVYSEIKTVFQFLESIGSARIEGNRTTVSEFVEKVIDRTIETSLDEKTKEIYNIDSAINFINDIVKEGTKIDKALIFEIHKKIVQGLGVGKDKEGSKSPGELRKEGLSITKSELVLPNFLQVPIYFEELIRFINQDQESKYDLLKIAVTHHRFAYAHPFDNGNGRTVRMLTYAMLIKYGFKIKQGGIINPTAIFCTDREKYYDMLSRADSNTEEGVEEWCYYVLEGLKKEMEKIDQISDLEYVRDKILKPVLEDAKERMYINDTEYLVLGYVISNKDMIFKSSDLESLKLNLDDRQRKALIKKLKENNIIKPIGNENARSYTFSFSKNYLLRSLIKVLSNEGFIPESINK
jgi:Fic family protein